MTGLDVVILLLVVAMLAKAMFVFALMEPVLVRDIKYWSILVLLAVCFFVAVARYPDVGFF